MRNVTVAKRYAKAMYMVASELNDVSDVLNGMSNLCLAFKSVPELKDVLFNPLLTPTDIQKIVKSVTSNKIILKSVAILAKRKRLDLILEIHEELARLVDEENGIDRVIIKTAHTLSDKEKRVIEKRLAEKIDSHVVGRFQVAKELLGGIWIKMGDNIFDATIKGRFDNLARYLSKSLN